MQATTVHDILQHDRWNIAEIKGDVVVALIRYRTPVLAPPHTATHKHLLTVVWPYSDSEKGKFPTHESSNEMEVFEDRFCEAVEQDELAILTAVLTYDGARQWVFYTRDVSQCGKRLTEMPQEVERYPVELSTELDPDWDYLRKKVLHTVLDKNTTETSSKSEK